MAANVRDILHASIVFVGGKFLNDESVVKALRDKREDEITVEQAVALGTQEERSITISKYRISINMLQGNSAVQQDYPNKESLATLAEIAKLVLEAADTNDVIAHGYNIHLVCCQDATRLASAYLAERLFSDFTSDSGWKIQGGQAGFRCADADGHTWNVTLEPRLREATARNVFLALNRHEAGLPDPEEIGERLVETLDEAIRFLHTLDRAAVRGGGE